MVYSNQTSALELKEGLISPKQQDHCRFNVGKVTDFPLYVLWETVKSRFPNLGLSFKIGSEGCNSNFKGVINLCCFY